MSVEKTTWHEPPPLPKLTPKKLRAIIEKELPEFVLVMKKARELNAVVVLHQDAFAIDLDEDELDLLALAIKYAGFVGVDVMIAGSDQERVTRSVISFPVNSQST